MCSTGIWPQTPDLVSLLNAYYTQRKAGAYSQKGKISNLTEMNETFNYLRANGIYTLEDLESRVNEHSSTTESLKKTLDGQTARTVSYTHLPHGRALQTLSISRTMALAVLALTVPDFWQ